MAFRRAGGGRAQPQPRGASPSSLTATTPARNSPVQARPPQRRLLVAPPSLLRRRSRPSPAAGRHESSSSSGRLGRPSPDHRAASRCFLRPSPGVRPMAERRQERRIDDLASDDGDSQTDIGLTALVLALLGVESHQEADENPGYQPMRPTGRERPERGGHRAQYRRCKPYRACAVSKDTTGLTPSGTRSSSVRRRRWPLRLAVRPPFGHRWECPGRPATRRDLRQRPGRCRHRRR